MLRISLKGRLGEGIERQPLYLVGGTVRDLLMDRLPKDIDLVCRNARAFASVAARTRNAALVPLEKKSDEPCYRVVDRDDPERFLDIAEMRGETIADDLRKRDFTINAIAVEVKEDGMPGALIDPLDGAGDIGRKIVKMTGADSLLSDPLRILRAVRLAAALGFTVERETWQEMQRRAPLLAGVSAERIARELIAILKDREGFRWFRRMDELGILGVIFPEIGAMRGCVQNGFHHRDAWEHSLLVMENCEALVNNLPHWFGTVSSEVAENLGEDNRLSLLKLACLLHDIGKPATRRVDPTTGRVTFFGHDEKGAELAGRISARLKLSCRDRDFIVLLIGEHLRPLHLAAEGVKEDMKMRWFRKMGDDSVPAIILAMADVKSIQGPDATDEYRQRLLRWSTESVMTYYLRTRDLLRAPDLISGNDLRALGMTPGPGMGKILDAVRDARDTGEIRNREEAINLAKKLLKRT